MSFFDEMADLAVEMLAEGDDGFGEKVIITRVGKDGYDPETRETTPGEPLRQEVQGTFDNELTSASAPGGLTSVYETVLLAAPRASDGFQPGQADRVIDVAGNVFVVMETAHVIKRGLPILWICGLVST